jgi:glycosyltransferase involved in cell wall biosynthesis
VHVHRLGPGDPALAGLYRAASVFCLPSRGDAAPFSVLEAMASGAAVVASALGGIPDFLDGGRCGRLIPPRDPAALREAVRGLLADATARDALAAAARRRCEERYDAVIQTRRLAALMREAA